jgi:hypothetical protein
MEISFSLSKIQPVLLQAQFRLVLVVQLVLNGIRVRGSALLKQFLAVQKESIIVMQNSSVKLLAHHVVQLPVTIIMSVIPMSLVIVLIVMKK